MHNSQFRRLRKDTQTNLRAIRNLNAELHQSRFVATRDMLELRQEIVERWNKTLKAGVMCSVSEPEKERAGYSGVWLNPPENSVWASMLLSMSYVAHTFSYVTKQNEGDSDSYPHYRGKFYATYVLPRPEMITRMEPKPCEDLLLIAGSFLPSE